MLDFRPSNLLSPVNAGARVAPVMSERVLVGLVLLIALASAGFLLWLAGDWMVAGGFFAMLAVVLAFLLLAYRLFPARDADVAAFDWSLVREAADNDSVALAVTDRAGRLVCANTLYEHWFEGAAIPPALSLAAEDAARLTQCGKAAWRDGRAAVDGLSRGDDLIAVDIMRGGRTESHLVWRFRQSERADPVAVARALVEGATGQQLESAGIMSALVAEDGAVIAASDALARRSLGKAASSIAGRDFATLMALDAQNVIRFAAEGRNGAPLRLVQIPVNPEAEGAPQLIIVQDEMGGGTASLAPANIASGMQAMLSKLPLGLALVDRDGRFMFLNEAFSRAVGVTEGEMPSYPGDLVVREDKAAVVEAIRRHATGQPLTADIAVRLNAQADEPVALTIAGARGLGDAAVLLSIKDSSEEVRLKKQVAQQTKMQAVGQLAGGVAHDFNNILTAILGHCDLILMRHTPGDSDYDDIQQIRNNSNRAASLTRQLLAFSRQQTLRPQILQLPDVVSEISALLKRLMGEMVVLEVKHGRNLGAVRADPGQLEQVIVNLSVNARDAMPRGGTLTIQTFTLGADEVQKLGSDFMPVGNYTGISVTDTGTGIPPELLSKIFEPFFTTKEVGKGTGLGLSTVYGIVKQSGGYIFADSTEGKGTRFSIYFPVYDVAPEEVAKPVAKAKVEDLWGSGVVMIVEDEDMVRAVAERALSRHGYTVRTATNGEEALELLAQDDAIDILVSDVVMPIMDGPTMVRHVRERRPDLPILFMSGYAEEQLRKSIAIDNVNFLPKPFSVQQLAEAVRAALPH